MRKECKGKVKTAPRIGVSAVYLNISGMSRFFEESSFSF
tara:strand:- start:580 stop:696 length:117 start_codon:yes stop_codon:yes gene_type:complete